MGTTPPAELTRLQRAGIVVLPAIARTLARSWRVTVANDAPWRAVRESGRPVIFAIWHGELFPGLLQRLGEPMAIVVSEHRDGEIIARVAARLGFRLVRGSTTRGGTRALLDMCRVIERGGDVGVTPDGPRGPARVAHPGALVAAARTGAPIVPASVVAERAWRLSSWDSFLVPRPFARVAVGYGDPIEVSASSAREAVAHAATLAAGMSEAERIARAALAHATGTSG